MKIASIRGSVKGVKSIVTGMLVSGDDYALVDSIDDPVAQQADVFLQTNQIKTKFTTEGILGSYEQILQSSKPFLVHESANFRQYAHSHGYTRLGWYSYLWTQGICGNENSPSDRWNKKQAATGIQLKDWRSPGDNIVIMGQKSGDSSLVDLQFNKVRFSVWVQQVIDTIRLYTDRPIVIRQHPRGRKGRGHLALLANANTNVSISDWVANDQDSSSGGSSLQADLDNAYCVVTYNSLSAVEAVVQGIPVFALHNGSMAWPVAHHLLSQIENLNYNIDRTQWCNDIAYTQWNSKELASGEAWAHLKPIIYR